MGKKISVLLFIVNIVAIIPLRAQLGMTADISPRAELRNGYRVLPVARHAHNGFMDFFTNIPVHTRNAGLINPFLKNRLKLSPKTTFDADLHLFWVMNPFSVNNVVHVKKFLGTEIDLTLNYRFNDFTQIIGGYLHMFATESMGLIKNGSTDQPIYFTYMMLKVRPKLL